MTFGEDHCKDVWAPFGLSITTSVVTSLLTVITVPGNLLICIAILKDPNKELRTSFNYLLMNVAISDLLVGAITDPIFVLFHIRYGTFELNTCLFQCSFGSSNNTALLTVILHGLTGKPLVTK